MGWQHITGPDSNRRPLLALFGHGLMSDLSMLSGVKRKSDFWAVRSAFETQPRPNADTSPYPPFLRRDTISASEV